jgi:hypothetical protein
MYISSMMAKARPPPAKAWAAFRSGQAQGRYGRRGSRVDDTVGEEAALQVGEEKGQEDGGEDADEDGGSPVVGGQGGQGEADGGRGGQEQGAEGQALAAVGAAAEVEEIADHG